MSTEVLSTAKAAKVLGYARRDCVTKAARELGLVPLFKPDGVTSGWLWSAVTVEQIAKARGRELNWDI